MSSQNLLCFLCIFVADFVEPSWESVHPIIPRQNPHEISGFVML